MKKHICVTIDGPSASGKSTVANELSKALHLLHIDTGAIYRSIAKWCIDQKIDITDEEKIIASLEQFHYSFEMGESGPRHFINDQDVTDAIRNPEVSQVSSKIAIMKGVRLIANGYQREIAKDRSVVVDGRDAGSVVFPEADVKIFLTASKSLRAKRRLKELKKKYKEKGERCTLASVLKEMQERDERDSQREAAPLRRAIDAYIVDTTHLSIKKITRKIKHIIESELQMKKPSRFWSWLIGKEKASATLYFKICHLLLKALFRLCYRLKAYGIENVPSGAVIFAPNHVSFLDPLVVGVMCPYEVYFLAHEYLFRLPIVGKMIAKGHVLPVNGSVQDTNSLKQIAAFLLKQRQVIIFPEGTRSMDGKIKPLKRGIALLASIVECPVIPVYVHGAYEAWPRKNKIPKLWGNISIHFGSPIYWKDYENLFDNKKESQIAMMGDVEKMLKELQAKAIEMTK